jgi:hypothetical protein
VIAIRKGEALKPEMARSAPQVEMTIPEQPYPDKLRVGLFAYDLVKDGPLAGLVSRAFCWSTGECLEVFLVALGTPPC